MQILQIQLGRMGNNTPRIPENNMFFNKLSEACRMNRILELPFFTWVEKRVYGNYNSK